MVTLWTPSSFFHNYDHLCIRFHYISMISKCNHSILINKTKKIFNSSPEGIVCIWCPRRCGRCWRSRAVPPMLRLEPLGVDSAERLHEVVVESHAPRRATLGPLRVASAAQRPALCGVGKSHIICVN